MKPIKGQKAAVVVRTANGKERDYPSLTHAAKGEGCSRATMKRCVDSGRMMPNGSVAAFRGEPLPEGQQIKIATKEVVAARPVPKKIREAAREMIPESEDPPEMDAAQMRWVAGVLKDHAGDLLRHACLLEKDAKELEESDE